MDQANKLMHVIEFYKIENDYINEETISLEAEKQDYKVTENLNESAEQEADEFVDPPVINSASMKKTGGFKLDLSDKDFDDDFEKF